MSNSVKPLEVVLGKGVGNCCSEREEVLTRHPENVPADQGKIFLQQAGMFSGGGMTRRAWEVPENVPADQGKILLQQAGMFSGGGMTRRAWEVAADAGAMPRTACDLVNGKGFGDPRQRSLRWR